MDYQNLGNATKALTGTSGTISLGHCHLADVEAVLDVNSSNTIALKASMSASATTSKANCDRVIGGPGIGYVPCRLYLPGGAMTKYLAYKVYTGGTVATTTSSRDRLLVTKLG